MNLRELTAFSALCVALFVLSGCAARESVKSVASASEITPALSSFNEQAAALPEGSAQYFAESPFGPATIEAGPRYLSGLGNECRSAHVTHGTISHTFALCRGKNGKWRSVPPIFESMSR